MTKQDIVDKIKQLAVERGGRISIRAFCRDTGIPEHQILGRHWGKWNDALTEAGVDTGSFFQAKTEDAAVVEAFALLAQKLRKWPTQTDLEMERRRNKTFPSIPVIRRVRSASPFVPRVLSYCAGRADLQVVAEIAAARAKEEESAEESVPESVPIVGYVYMMRSGRRYKIGRTSSPARRHREVRLDLPDPTTVVHTIATDDPVGIEAYWHSRFQSKRVRETEFFALDARDLAAFKRWKRIA